MVFTLSINKPSEAASLNLLWISIAAGGGLVFKYMGRRGGSLGNFTKRHNYEEGNTNERTKMQMQGWGHKLAHIKAQIC